MKVKDKTRIPNQNSQITELWLHYLWKEKAFKDVSMSTKTGEELKIVFPGWYNKGWGPDFKNARIEIDETLYFGDIEIHIDEASWNRHSHHHDEAYNKVILHVFLHLSEFPVRNKLNQTIPSLHLHSKNFKTFWASRSPSAGFNLNELPGACGLFMSDEKSIKLKDIIRRAAEERLVRKSKPFEECLGGFNHNEAQDLLFTSICKSLGYAANSEGFIALSQRYPYTRVKRFFEALHRQSRKEILGRWLGYLGYLHSMDINSLHQELRREWLGFVQTWNNLKEKQHFKATGTRSASRPLNNPIRRLTGLYYHLEASWFQGLIKTWLMFFNRCQAVIQNNL